MLRAAVLLFGVVAAIAPAVSRAAPAREIAGEPRRYAGKCRLEGLGSVTAMVESFANAPTIVAVYKDGKKVAATPDGAEFEIYGKDLDIVCVGDRIRLSSGVPARTGSDRLLLALKKGTLEVLDSDADPGYANDSCEARGECDDGNSAAAGAGQKDKGAIKKIAKVHQQALALFRAGKKAEAVKRLGAILTEGPPVPGHDQRALTVQPPVDEDLPEIVALENDYAFFLAETGRTKDAAAFLRGLVLAHPDRTVAHLNLADALWTLGVTAEAQAEYYEYGARVPEKQWPPRVKERCPLCVE